MVKPCHEELLLNHIFISINAFFNGAKTKLNST